jgi:cell division protein FtsB
VSLDVWFGFVSLAIVALLLVRWRLKKQINAQQRSEADSDD